VADEVVEYPQNFMAQLFMRMSPEHARLYASTNPGNPYSSLKTDVLDNPTMAGDMQIINFTLHDNPNLSKTAKDAIIRSQVGVFKLRYIDGLWVVAEGSIYRDCWSDQENTFADAERSSDNGKYTHAARPVGLLSPGGWAGYKDRWYAVDPGVDHPQVTGEFYDDGHTVWLNRTLRWDSRKEMRQKTDGQYADDLEEFMGGKDYQVIVPPEAASYKAELASRGFWVTDADNTVIDGIHTVSTLLGRRILKVNVDGCNGIEKRIPVYAWDKKASKLGKEEPLKVEDDDCDMLRYGVHGKIPMWRWAN
jgi:hypothetical protein